MAVVFSQNIFRVNLSSNIHPYDSIPPYGEQSIAHPAKNVKCMCSDAVAQAQIDDGAIPLWEAIPAILAAAAAE